MSLRMLGLGFSVVALAGCGQKDASKAKMTPLTAGQKAQVTYVAQSIDVANNSAEQVAGQSQTHVLSMQSMPPVFDKAQKTQDLEKALKGNCQTQNNLPNNSDGNLPQNGEYHLTVNGVACPIDMDMGMSYQTVASQSAVDVQISMLEKYMIKDAQVAATNDIQQLQLKGVVRIHGSQAGVAGSGGFHGQVVSRLYGTLGLSIDMNISSNSQSGAISTVSETIAFPNFTAVGKVVAQATPDNRSSISYFINDEQVSQKDFQNVFGTSLENTSGGVASVHLDR